MKFSAKICTLASVISLSSSLSFSPMLNAAQFAELGFILTSIKPLQLIAQDITEGVVESVALLPPGASPHSYALRPSEAKKIANAQSIYWIGPTLETFLEKPFTKYAAKSHSLVAFAEDEHSEHSEDKHESHDDHKGHDNHANHDDHKGHDDHADHNDHKGHDNHADHNDHKGHDDHADHDNHKGHDDHADQEDHHDHNHGGVDPHIWLSPEIAVRIAQTIKQQTVALYPQHKVRLEQNYQNFAASIKALDKELNHEFSHVKGKGFLVFHDAYGHFNQHYQLNQISALTINPAKRPGAKHLAEIRQQIAETKPACIFSEPQFSDVAITTVVRGTNVKKGILDPLASEHEASSNRYVSYIDEFAHRIINCLKSA